MCDYSLHAFRNRLAVDGEDLVVHRFLGASVGLTSPAELRPPSNPDPSGKNSVWTKIASWFKAHQPAWELEKRLCAVCIPPGARLILRDIPKRLQKELRVGETEEVTFQEISADVNSYRDAVRFSNQRQILLQALEEGQRVTVLSIGPSETVEPFVYDGRVLASDAAPVTRSVR